MAPHKGINSGRQGADDGEFYVELIGSMHTRGMPLTRGLRGGNCWYILRPWEYMKFAISDLKNPYIHMAKVWDVFHFCR